MPFPDMHLHCLNVAQNTFDWPVYAFSATFSAAIFKSDCKIRDQLEERKSATKLVFGAKSARTGINAGNGIGYLPWLNTEV